MLTLFTIMLVLASASVHELGHAWAMSERNVPIKRISLLGLPWPNITWHLPIRSKRFPGTEWVLHPMVLGAYVQPMDENALEKISPRDRVYIAAMGPIGSVAAGVVLMGFAITAIRIDTANAITLSALYSAGISIASLAVLWFLRHFIARFICLLIGVAMLGLIIWAIMQFGLFKSFIGPIGLVDIVHTYAGSETDVHKRFVAVGVEYFAIWNAFYLAGILSILIGLSNLLPFAPLDGGHIAVAYMSPRWRSRFEYVTKRAVLALFAVAIASDVLRIWHI